MGQVSDASQLFATEDELKEAGINPAERFGVLADTSDSDESVELGGRLILYRGRYAVIGKA